MLKRIELTVETITPLHIGTGRKLLRDFDFAVHGGHTFRLHEDRLAEALHARDPKLAEQLLRTPPAQLVRPADLTEGSPFVRYVLPGEPQGQEFREAIKDPHDRPYLPGSSVKGALRTVLAWHGWKELRLDLAASLQERNRRVAARPLERKIFGPDPHHDLLRPLRIADSSPGATANLEIQVVRVWTRRGAAAPISVEAVKAGVTFTLRATLDETLWSAWSHQAPGFPLPHRDWIERLAELATQRATERLRREKELWDSWGRPGATNPCGPVLASLIRLKKRGSSAPAFPLQLGFGTGWEGTTIGAPLKSDPQWRDVFTTFDLGLVPGKRGVKADPDKFPTSRRMVTVGDAASVVPLGWVWVEWKEAR